jgi:hypothetical protein
LQNEIGVIVIEPVLPEDTMGTGFVLESLLRYFGRSYGNPAQAKILFIPSSADARPDNEIPIPIRP